MFELRHHVNMAKRGDNDISELQRRLEEAEETLRAIRQGEVDALVIDGPKGEVIYTLTSADYPYRLMIDEMNEGAVSVSPDSHILYTNRNFSSILGLTESKASGVPFGDFIIPEMREQFLRDVEKAREQSIRREYRISRDGRGNSGAPLVCEAPASNKFDQYRRHGSDSAESSRRKTAPGKEHARGTGCRAYEGAARE
jgi:PAS domain S-box-containing protein